MSEQFPYSFGKYRMEAEIGRGGFGTVFRAVDVDLDRQVAIKIMDPIYMRDTRWVARFRREARMMAQLDHPHIVPIYEIGEVEGRLYLAMKLVDGPDLTEMIKQKGALPWDMVVEMVAQIASALDYAHERKIIHRDLKPGNILVSNESAILTDFGLAQMMESNSQSISVSGGFAGTYNYMPPEVFNNEGVTPVSDVYALGCVLYEMLTGDILFEGETTAAIIGAHLKGIRIDEALLEGTPPGTREILQIAVAKDPLDRYASAAELAQEVERISNDRLTVPYAELEHAVAVQYWAEAITLAAEIRAQDPNYRDIAALEARAQRGQWSKQRRAEAEQALAKDDFDVVRGVLIQWRRVDPSNQDIQRFEEELALAEQYVTLEQLIADREWKAAQPAASAIFAQDPYFRDIGALQAEINDHDEPPPGATAAAALTGTAQDEQDLSATGVALASGAALSRDDNIPEAATASVTESKPQESVPARPSVDPVPPKRKGTGVPAWAWWVGAIAILLLLVFGIQAMFGGGAEGGDRIVTASIDGTAKVWDGLSGTELLTLSGHESSVWSASFNSDGDRIVTTSDDGMVKVWDAGSGAKLLTLSGHEGSVWSASFNPDGDRIVTASEDGTAKVWDAGSGAELLTLSGHEGNVWSASFNPNGDRIVTAGDDGTAIVWAVPLGTKLRTLIGHEYGVNSANFNRDGDRIVTASSDGTAKVWNGLNGAELLTLSGNGGRVWSASFNPNGDRIVTASEDGTAKVWDGLSGTKLRTLRGHEDWVGSASFNPNGDRIVTASSDGTAKVWDALRGTKLRTLRGHDDSVISASFNP